MTTLLIIGSNNLDRTIEVQIDNVRYEYWFHGEVPISTLRKILRYSAGRAIQYLKKNSYKVVRLDANGTTQKAS